MITGSPYRIDRSTQLPLWATRGTKIVLDRIDELASALNDGRWHTARELAAHGFSDRELRNLVEDSDGRVFSFPGSPGYKLFDFVTEEEFAQCASLKHQAERMLARYSRYQARHHRGK